MRDLGLTISSSLSLADGLDGFLTGAFLASGSFGTIAALGASGGLTAGAWIVIGGPGAGGAGAAGGGAGAAIGGIIGGIMPAIIPAMPKPAMISGRQAWMAHREARTCPSTFDRSAALVSGDSVAFRTLGVTPAGIVGARGGF